MSNILNLELPYYYKNGDFNELEPFFTLGFTAKLQ
jgi:hypothetical protein